MDKCLKSVGNPTVEKLPTFESGDCMGRVAPTDAIRGDHVERKQRRENRRHD
ncbi:uncharacterized protein G2W53_007297 [Senna tora]|uniref:Uncharacterized protein n=1 Tax=Senna tora TaxID=362788 RepID=A0A835CFJ3_9FABA|nr:uncharacterized protein G2W53_007297 [Senna tora]